MIMECRWCGLPAAPGHEADCPVLEGDPTEDEWEQAAESDEPDDLWQIGQDRYERYIYGDDHD